MSKWTGSHWMERVLVFNNATKLDHYLTPQFIRPIVILTGAFTCICLLHKVAILLMLSCGYGTNNHNTWKDNEEQSCLYFHFESLSTAAIMHAPRIDCSSISNDSYFKFPMLPGAQR